MLHKTCLCLENAFEKAFQTIQTVKRRSPKCMGSSVFLVSQIFGVSEGEILEKLKEMDCDYPFSLEALRSTRKAAGLTQRQAANKLGVALITWSKWETGERAMPFSRWITWLRLTEGGKENGEKDLW